MRSSVFGPYPNKLAHRRRNVRSDTPTESAIWRVVSADRCGRFSARLIDAFEWSGGSSRARSRAIVFSMRLAIAAGSRSSATALMSRSANAGNTVARGKRTPTKSSAAIPVHAVRTPGRRATATTAVSRGPSSITALRYVPPTNGLPAIQSKSAKPPGTNAGRCVSSPIVYVQVTAAYGRNRTSGARSRYVAPERARIGLSS